MEEKHSFVRFDEAAECYVINTCTVTDRADWEARQLVRRAKRRNPAAKVLVTGCYAQVNPDEVAEVPGVDFVVGLNRLDDLLRFVECRSHGRKPQIAVSDVKRERGVPVLGTRALPGHTRAFLKIQEGCNYSCTYCIIPTARGLSRSVDAARSDGAGAPVGRRRLQGNRSHRHSSRRIRPGFKSEDRS